MNSKGEDRTREEMKEPASALPPLRNVCSDPRISEYLHGVAARLCRGNVLLRLPPKQEWEVRVGQIVRGEATD